MTKEPEAPATGGKSQAREKDWWDRTFDNGKAAKVGCLGFLLPGLVGIAVATRDGESHADTSVANAAKEPARVAPNKSYPTYKASDFDWDGTPEGVPYKAKLIAMVNRLVRENDRCASVEPYSLSRTVDGFSKQHPTFFIVCKTPDGQSFGATFNANDADSSLAAAKPISEVDAAVRCDAEARDATEHPEMASVSILNGNYASWPDGRARYTTTFTAKNSFGMKHKYRIICYFGGPVLKTKEIKEER